MRKKKNDARPLPPMFVGDEEQVTERIREEAIRSSVGLAGTPHAVAEELAQPAPARTDGTAATEYVEYPDTGCGLYFWVTFGILMSAMGAGMPDPFLGWLFVIVPLLMVGLYLWNTLHDQNVADADRTPLYPFGYLRRWLRRVLNIHWET